MCCSIVFQSVRSDGSYHKCMYCYINDLFYKRQTGVIVIISFSACIRTVCYRFFAT